MKVFAVFVDGRVVSSSKSEVSGVILSSTLGADFMLVSLEMPWQVVDMACLMAIMVLFTFKEFAECEITSNPKTCDEIPIGRDLVSLLRVSAVFTQSPNLAFSPYQKSDEMWQPKSLDQYEICADAKGNPKSFMIST